tara:strand:+ start:196 stop:576 length:381 start_codon:yes stop_codon:yes gene_type:complete
MDNWHSIFWISFGVSLGANLRVIILENFNFRSIKRHWVTCIINVISSFLLGFLLSLTNEIQSMRFSEEIFSFFSLGFLGGLSSFSTFIFELFSFLKSKQFHRFINLLVFSVSLCLFAAYAGYLTGR